MMLLATNTGLRASELVGLQTTAVDLGPSPQLRVTGKGRKERVLPLWRQTVRALQAWLAVRGTPRAQTLFVNARGGALTRWGLAHVLRKHWPAAVARCPSLANKRITPHVLRHTCAMAVLHATHDLRKVSLWLGHESIQTTETYTQADATEKIEVAAAFVPPSLRRGRFAPPDRLMALLQPNRPPKNYVEREAAA